MQIIFQKVLKRFYKPEYYYQPLRIIDRIRYKLRPPVFGMQKIKLSWGRFIIANPQQTIGHSLSTYGLYDLALSEMIIRLVKPGDTVIDGGANVGYTSCLMLDCLNDKGRLLSYEPIPKLFKVLKDNLGESKIAEPYMVALSDKMGSAQITMPVTFEGNDGVATLEGNNIAGEKIEIPTITIDSLGINTKVKLLKLDVEGHELSVLKGGSQTLDRNIFEYIIFEDLSGADGETSKYLESKGYKIFKIIKSFSGLVLKDPSFNSNLSYEPENFLATKDINIVDKINSHVTWNLFNWNS